MNHHHVILNSSTAIEPLRKKKLNDLPSKTQERHSKFLPLFQLSEKMMLYGIMCLFRRSLFDMKPGQAQRIFERDSFTCQYCLRQFAPEGHPLHAHHRVFVSQGGRDDDDNLASCCWECHHNHGALKNAKLKSEPDYSVIEELKDRYAIKPLSFSWAVE